MGEIDVFPKPCAKEKGRPSESNGDFRSLHLSEPLLQSLEASGYRHPTEIQKICIPLLLKGEDVLGLAQTGSGKTAAFALPGLQEVDLQDRRIQMLVLAPTRELALQVTEALNHYAKFLPGFLAITIYGGQRYDVQARALKQMPHAIVGTPGRLLDLLRSKSIDLKYVKFLVLDEADEMLRMGFIEPITEILTSVPTERKTALFSATMPEPIRRISKRFMKNPKEVKIESAMRTAVNIAQTHCVVAAGHKELVLTRFLESQKFEAAIVFVKTKSATLTVTKALERAGHRVAALNGDMTQSAREHTLAQLKANEIDVLVATDVAARGLDVDRLGWVINYDLPVDSESYVHRIGRTGRAGRTGQALLFVEPQKIYLLKKLERLLKLSIPEVKVPTVAQLKLKRLERWTELLQETMDDANLESLYAPMLHLLKERLKADPEQLALALFKLAQVRLPVVKPHEVDLKPASASSYGDGGHGRRPASSRFESRRSQPYRASESEGSDASSRARHKRPMQLYTLDLGRRDGLEPRHLVGALVHEGGLASSAIGNIKLFADSTTLELAAHLSPANLQALSKVRLFNRPLKLQPASK